MTSSRYSLFFFLPLQHLRDDFVSLSFWLSCISIVLYNLGDKNGDKIQMDSLSRALKIGLAGASPAEHMQNLFIRTYAMLMDSIREHSLNILTLFDLFRSVKPHIVSMLEPGEAGAKSPKSFTTFLSSTLSTLQQYFVHIALVKEIFVQIFQFIDASCFNEIILRRDLCSYANALDLKMRLLHLDDWTKVSKKKWCESKAILLPR